MRLKLSTYLECTMEQAVEAIRTPQLLYFVAAPLLHFVPHDPPSVPNKWKEGTYWFRLYFFGFIPIGKQAIVISFPNSDQSFQMRDNGFGGLIRRWDHLMTINKAGTYARYEDRLHISAGLFTPLVWLFAFAFYKHRQYRWRRLVRDNFKYPKSD